MKKRLVYLGCFILCAFASSSGYAQTYRDDQINKFIPRLGGTTGWYPNYVRVSDSTAWPFVIDDGLHFVSTQWKWTIQADVNSINTKINGKDSRFTMDHNNTDDCYFKADEKRYVINVSHNEHVYDTDSWNSECLGHRAEAEVTITTNIEINKLYSFTTLKQLL